jgi:hypothetical protein
MMMMSTKYVLATAGAVALMASMQASALTITATATGPINAYFYGFSASYGSDVGLSIGNVDQGIYALFNKNTPKGTMAFLGNAIAGQTLVFELRVDMSGGDPDNGFDYSVFSDPSQNSDGAEHTQASAYSAGEYGIPVGTLIGFEDIIPLSASDKDYNDHMFVFTNLSVPDNGSTIALMGLGLVAFGLIRRKLA